MNTLAWPQLLSLAFLLGYPGDTPHQTAAHHRCQPGASLASLVASTICTSSPALEPWWVWQHSDFRFNYHISDVLAASMAHSKISSTMVWYWLHSHHSGISEHFRLPLPLDMMKTEDTLLLPGFVFISCKAGLTVSMGVGCPRSIRSSLTSCSEIVALGQICMLPHPSCLSQFNHLVNHFFHTHMLTVLGF